MISIKGDIVDEHNQYDGLIIPATTQGKFWGQGELLTRVFPGLKQNYVAECRSYPRRYEPGQCWSWSPLSGDILLFVISSVIVSPAVEPLRPERILKALDSVIDQSIIYRRQRLAMPCLTANAARDPNWESLKRQIAEKFDAAGISLALYEVHLAAFAVEAIPNLVTRS